MKKIALFIALATITVACDKNDEVVITLNELPQASQTLITTHFGDKKISRVERENEGKGRVSYDVYFADGTCIDFDQKGEWEEMKSPTGLPESVVPEKIWNYAETNHPTALVVELEKQNEKFWSGYEIELSNELELLFDSNYDFVKYSN